MFFINSKYALLFRRLPQIMKMETSISSTESQQLGKTIKEGQAEMYVKTEKVFYNPVQEFNRDLSIAVLSVFTEEYEYRKLEKLEHKFSNDVGVTILEALSATGLRSIRYAKEVPYINKIVANDLSKQAVETMKANIVHNNVQNLIETSHDDACMLMYKHKHSSKRFTVIDLDPYGCPSTFLDAAVQSVEDGGMLLVTATDMAVLAGNAPETCYSKYGAISLKVKCCHEMALRILLQCIESHANRYSRYIVPVLSISADFYIRVFVKVYSGALHCKETTSKLSMVYRCVGCDNITLQPLGGFKPNPSEKNPDKVKACLPIVPPVTENCEHCNQKHNLGGPIWSAPIHDKVFVSRVLDRVKNNPELYGTSKRIRGMLSMVQEEVESPLYYTLDKLFHRVHLPTMSMMVMRSAILHAGYEVSYSHASRLSVKTNAPARVIWDIVRTWQKTHPIKPAKLQSDPAAQFILSQEIQTPVELSQRADANPGSRRDGQLRFQFNPEPFWGPGTRAAINVGDKRLPKKLRNQNKYTPKAKRQHSPEDENERKKPTPEDSNLTTV